ncbi:unnamed protein product [Miscanthus lutarioriparius]|uniref:Uncharacterized protein n=1 Tax=Miscanthus lutarioriparius TaxID=422564 RepID=A0A811RGA1_9POAL|nr:unnamed protein product [Miscanthus lutarioriparius]
MAAHFEDTYVEIMHLNPRPASEPCRRQNGDGAGNHLDGGDRMPKDWPCIAPVAATTPGTSYDGPTAKAYVRRLGNTASPRRPRHPGRNGSMANVQFRHLQQRRTCKSPAW